MGWTSQMAPEDRAPCPGMNVVFSPLLFWWGRALKEGCALQLLRVSGKDTEVVS